VANFIEDSPGQVTFVLLRYFEREALLIGKGKKSEAEDGVKKLCDFFNEKLCHWTKLCNNLSGFEVSEDEAALLWGVITCYPRLCDSQDGLLSIRNLISGLDQLLITEDGTLVILILLIPTCGFQLDFCIVLWSFLKGNEWDRDMCSFISNKSNLEVTKCACLVDGEGEIFPPSLL
jgi:hypothetical protein